MSSAILKLEERLRLAMVSSDVEELDALLSPDLLFTTFLGEVISKSDDLAAHQSGLLTMHSIDLSEHQFRAVGDATVATCLAEIDATFDDDRSKKKFRFTRVWAPDADGKLRIVAGQATLVYSSLMED